MIIYNIENETKHVDFCKNDDLVLVSYLPITYLQGIRGVEGLKAILIGDNGKQIQYPGKASMKASYDSLTDAIKGEHIL
jgi:hypothetical protein